MRACSRTRRSAGIKIAINMATMAMTTNSSINVKPFNFSMMGILSLLEQVFLGQSFI
jgi:hypothetical protein